MAYKQLFTCINNDNIEFRKKNELYIKWQDIMNSELIDIFMINLQTAVA